MGLAEWATLVGGVLAVEGQWIGNYLPLVGGIIAVIGALVLITE